MKINGNFTIRDVARELGLSVSTVSNVINNKNTISEATRQRVLKTMKRMQYMPNRFAQSLVTKKSKTIALLVPSLDNPFFSNLNNGVYQYINEKRPDYKIMIGNTRYSTELERNLIRSFRQELADGYILVSNDPSNEEIMNLRRSRIPYVFAMNDPRAVTDAPLVTYDQYDAAYMATEHFIKMGHTKIGYITGFTDELKRAEMRFLGFRRCLEDHQILFEERFFAKCGKYTPECGFTAFMNIYANGGVPTAVLCSGDIIAVGVISAIWKIGLNVPADISVIGFDNIPSSPYLYPPLTTVNINLLDMGYEAADVLFRYMDEQDVRHYKHIHEVEILHRESCTHPPS
jgi:LacI family transcriptional regulator